MASQSSVKSALISLAVFSLQFLSTIVFGAPVWPENNSTVAAGAILQDRPIGIPSSSFNQSKRSIADPSDPDDADASFESLQHQFIHSRRNESASVLESMLSRFVGSWLPGRAEAGRTGRSTVGRTVQLCLDEDDLQKKFEHQRPMAHLHTPSCQINYMKVPMKDHIPNFYYEARCFDAPFIQCCPAEKGAFNLEALSAAMLFLKKVDSDESSDCGMYRVVVLQVPVSCSCRVDGGGSGVYSNPEKPIKY